MSFTTEIVNKLGSRAGELLTHQKGAVTAATEEVIQGNNFRKLMKLLKDAVAPSADSFSTSKIVKAENKKLGFFTRLSEAWNLRKAFKKNTIKPLTDVIKTVEQKATETTEAVAKTAEKATSAVKEKLGNVFGYSKESAGALRNHTDTDKLKAALTEAFENPEKIKDLPTELQGLITNTNLHAEVNQLTQTPAEKANAAAEYILKELNGQSPEEFAAAVKGAEEYLQAGVNRENTIREINNLKAGPETVKTKPSAAKEAAAEAAPSIDEAAAAQAFDEALQAEKRLLEVLSKKGSAEYKALAKFYETDGKAMPDSLAERAKDYLDALEQGSSEKTAARTAIAQLGKPTA